MARLTVTDEELGVLAEALREALAADLLRFGSRAVARELLDRVDQRLPAATDRHPAGRQAGRVIAGDDILRLLLRHEERYGVAALTNEQIAAEVAWKPAGTSIRELLDELRRNGWLSTRGTGAQRRFELTRKGRGRARALQHTPAAPDDEARVQDPDELLDLIYADSTPCSSTLRDDVERPVAGVWHRPTVQAAARLDDTELAWLEETLRGTGMIGDPVGSYGTLTPAGEQHARERWYASRPTGAYGGPPRPVRPYERARSTVARYEDRACPNCGRHASWLARKTTKRWDELRGRGEVDYHCADCHVAWTIYLEPTTRDGRFDPRGDPGVCRPRWCYRGGWLRGEAIAPPDHHPALIRT